MDPTQLVSMKKRLLHLALLAIGIGIPILTVVQAALGNVQLGAGWSVGIIAAGIVAVASNVRRFLPAPTGEEVGLIAKWLNILGGLAATASTVLVLWLTSIPAGGKAALVGATLAGLLASLRTVGGAGARGAVPASEAAQQIVQGAIPRDKGNVELRAIIIVAIIGLLAIVALLALTPRKARAETPQPQLDLPGTLGCFDSARDFCGRLVMPAGVGGLSLLSRKVSYGAFTGGIGLGVDLWAQRWHTVTPALAIAAKAESGANFANIAGLLGLCKVAWIGGMVHIDSALTEWSLLAGIDPITVVTMLKGSPEYVAAAQRGK